MTSGYQIEGGYPVIGEIQCLGAKNFITKAMVASLLGNTPSILTNVPPIGDTQITVELLQSVGVDVQWDKSAGTMALDPSGASRSDIEMPHSGSNRVPVLLLGALLGRFDSVSVPVLGGCKIGARKVDFHLEAIRLFGGKVDENDAGFCARRHGRLVGTQVELAYPSVGATEICLYLAVLARGRSVIRNAAIEPEIFELITMLRAMGAEVYTSPGREIVIEGKGRLHGTRMNILGDRIEAASWAALACASNGSITVHGIRPEILGNFLSYFRSVGGGTDLVGPSSLRFYRDTDLRPVILETDVYPGFSTDWQQPFAVLLTQADGVSVIHETVYEKRFGYLTDLRRMGARVQLTTHCLGSAPCRYKGSNYEHSAIIVGNGPLQAVDRLEIPDLRAGLAYVVAATIARGTTVLTGLTNIERGYGDIVPRLAAMDLRINRVTV